MIFVLIFLFLAGALSAAELPVRHVVLYKHGVGFFERSGELAPGEGARLDFKASEMNDVLKSLTLEVKGGKGVAGLRYDSSEPLNVKLQRFPLNLGTQQPVSALLDQWKGAQLELKINSQTITGAIVSARLIAAGTQREERETVTLLLSLGELRTFDLAGATLRFPDPTLQLQLRDYLTTLTQARSTDKRSVYIDSIDSARRNIAASYMIPTPVWKSSYRLIFNPTSDPTLEGWAIIDNTSGEDWTNVRLSLVSGRPISFISKLYEPKYLERPVAELPEDKAVAPIAHAGVIAMEQKIAAANRLRAMAPHPAAPPPRQEAAFADAEALGEVRESTLAATSQGRELGDLFEYRFDQPVTVRKSESAMIPFLQQKLAARKLLIYSDHSSPHPRHAAELTNASGKTLDGGPITVYDASAYAGEALFETVKTGDKRLISYGIDIGTRITTAFDSKAGLIREVKLQRGVLTTRMAFHESRTYTIRNVDSKAKVLVIEHPVRPGYRLLNQKPAESTATAHRFEIKLAPAANEKFTVDEERLLDQTYLVSDVTPDFLVTLVQNKELSPAGRKSLETILDRKRQIAQTDQEQQRAEGDIKELFQDQERIRQNLSSLNRVSGQQEQVQRYSKQLADQETSLVQLRDRVAELRKRKAALETELRGLITKLEF